MSTADPAVRLVIGNYYPNRGYWDGRRYYQHRITLEWRLAVSLRRQPTGGAA